MACASLLPWGDCLLTVILETNILRGTPLISFSSGEDRFPGTCVMCWWQNGDGRLQWRNSPFYPLGLFKDDNYKSSTERSHACVHKQLPVVKFYGSGALPCCNQYSGLVHLNRTVLGVCVVNMSHMCSEKRSFHLSQNVCIFRGNKLRQILKYLKKHFHEWQLSPDHR